MYAKPMNLQQKVGEVIGVNYPPAAQHHEMYGVEVELEGAGGIAAPTVAVKQFWTVHNDGSLRKLKPEDEAIEYVTKIPLTFDEVAKAVKSLTDFLNEPQKKVYDSYRTSIHVHVNCLADTNLHVYNFITLCLLFDELFVSQNGEHRVGNNFCLRAKDAQGQVVELIKLIEVQGQIYGINPNNRYSSINFASLTKFGTVEFRSLECTTDPIRILHWIRTIGSMKSAARSFENPQDIIQKFSQMGIGEFVLRVLGPQGSKYIRVPGFEAMLFQGMRIAQEFAFCSKWLDKPKGSKKEEDAIDKYIKKVKAHQINMIEPVWNLNPAQHNNWQVQFNNNPPAAVDVDIEAQPAPVWQPEEPPMHDDDDDDFDLGDLDEDF